MNLHNIASQYVCAVNPWITATILTSTGYTTNNDGTRVPSYGNPQNVMVQMQSLTYQDLMQLDGLNIQGERHAMYINGNWSGVVRSDNKGGDIIQLQNGTTWLVAQVLENWSEVDGWVKVCVTKQLNS